MKIEVAVPNGATTKERGDLLEKLSDKLLSAQSYEVVKEIRMTAVELDLLCKHKVSGKEIYVECKAHKNNIDANVLKNLAGTQVLKGYNEAWLISTAELGKEAKGFVKEWQSKPSNVASTLSFYTPDKVIDSLINSNTIKRPPKDTAAKCIGSENFIGDWVLSITPYGNFWFAVTLNGGIPAGVITYYAQNNEEVSDLELLRKISSTDTSLSELDFFLHLKGSASIDVSKQEESVDVVEVQYGDSWSDYRPARPKDFVGRSKDLKEIFDFFKRILNKETSTRIFALTGDSGMGKSSLITKIADKSKNKFNKNKYFIYPVDVRAAISPSYIYSALLKCLKSAQDSGFGDSNIELNVTDVSSPLNSESIRGYIVSLESKNQLVVLIFDQFEELYSKQELYDVFNRAKSLFLGTAALKNNFCLGFAWKSDSTTHNEHPAYFFWHQLSDYRLTRKLSPFSDGESTAAINIFEKEIKQKLHNDLRHNLLVSSQGYPWLLKKLCIHLYEKINSGILQEDLIENKLDIASLFDADLKLLSQAERACLEFISQRAPVDWFEVIELSGAETLNSLIHRRLVIRSGDRLNIYWDIFREYILTSKVPIIPLRYLPSNDFTSVYTVVQFLEKGNSISLKELVDKSGLSEGTVQNIGSDIYMFGIASREGGSYILDPELNEHDQVSILRQVREKFKKHAFAIALHEQPSNSIILTSQAVNILKEIFANNSYAEKTWRSYTIRLCRWLELCGLITPVDKGWVYRDKGDVVLSRARSHSRHKGKLFTAPASPALTLDVLRWVLQKQEVSKEQGYPKGYRNALSILSRFELTSVEKEKITPNKNKISKLNSLEEAIWTGAGHEPVLQEIMKLLEKNENITGKEIGQMISEKYELRWTEASKVRNGGGMKQWASWLLEGKRSSTIPPCPGRI